MKKKQSLDESLKLLEEIVDKMENNDLLLEDALKLYKDGSKLVTNCKEKLTAVEGEILIIQKNMSEWDEQVISEDE